MILAMHWKDILTAQGVDCSVLPAEWDMLKQQLYANDNVQDITWKQINAKYKPGMSNILDLIDLVLSLPASSAECEWGFSIMKLTKTDYRNKLSSQSMTEIMRIKLHSPRIEDFDPTPAIHMWNSGSNRQRRPNFMATSSAVLTDMLASAGEQCSSSADAEQSKSAGDSDCDSLTESDYESCGSDFEDNPESETDLFDLADSIAKKQGQCHLFADF
ncbi:uncharacterized protein [Ptychodera flava]|uniref:uncharacterized protein n=1 Tax=Ptychodera flava TaxID=63121 RepID=UPI003969D0EE